MSDGLVDLRGVFLENKSTKIHGLLGVAESMSKEFMDEFIRDIFLIFGITIERTRCGMRVYVWSLLETCRAI